MAWDTGDSEHFTISIDELTRLQQDSEALGRVREAIEPYIRRIGTMDLDGVELLDDIESAIADAEGNRE